MNLPQSAVPEQSFSTDAAFMHEIEKTLGKDVARSLFGALDAEIERVEQAAFLRGFKTATQWIAGPKWAGITIAILTGSLEKSDNKIAKELGVSRAAVGKHIRKLRANAGLALRIPNNSHGEETARGIEAARKRKRAKAKRTAASATQPDLT